MKATFILGPCYKVRIKDLEEDNTIASLAKIRSNSLSSAKNAVVNGFILVFEGVPFLFTPNGRGLLKIQKSLLINPQLSSPYHLQPYSTTNKQSYNFNAIW